MDPTVLGQLIDEHAAALVLYARQWCSSPQCAAPEDVVQEAFLKLSAQRTAPARVVPWLYRVVRNGAISALRSAARRRRHESLAAERRLDWFEPQSAGTIDLDEAVRALQQLHDDEREIITLRLWGGLTFAEASEVLQVPASTLHRWYEEGLSTLRRRLDVPCPKKT